MPTTPWFLRSQRMRRIVKHSRAFAERLVAHVRATVNPQRGDTLMLVDLGYNGSVQNQVEALLREALGVHVAGRDKTEQRFQRVRGASHHLRLPAQARLRPARRRARRRRPRRREATTSHRRILPGS